MAPHSLAPRLSRRATTQWLWWAKLTRELTLGVFHPTVQTVRVEQRVSRTTDMRIPQPPSRQLIGSRRAARPALPARPFRVSRIRQPSRRTLRHRLPIPRIHRRLPTPPPRETPVERLPIPPRRASRGRPRPPVSYPGRYPRLL